MRLIALLLISLSLPAWAQEPDYEPVYKSTLTQKRVGPELLTTFECAVGMVPVPVRKSEQLQAREPIPPPPLQKRPPPPRNLCLKSPAQFNEWNAGTTYVNTVQTTEETDRLAGLMVEAGKGEGKTPLKSGPASLASSTQACGSKDPICLLTHLFDQDGVCVDGQPCDARENAYRALTMGKSQGYYPTLAQWYPETARWPVETLREISHVFDMVPGSSKRLAAKDKELRMFPKGTAIGDCPGGNAPCKAGQAWPVSPEVSSTSGMAHISFLGERPPYGYGDAHILLTDRLVNGSRMATCKGLVHELTHHFDYSFMFDPENLDRTRADDRAQAAALAKITQQWGVRSFGKYSFIPVDDADGKPSIFANLSWNCTTPTRCTVKPGETAGFVSDYARQVGPMDDFAESVSTYVCNPVELFVRSPVKYQWLKNHLFLDRATQASREFWQPDSENWPGLDQALAIELKGIPAMDGLVSQCLSDFVQFSRKRIPDGPASSVRVTAFYPDPDPEKQKKMMLKGYQVTDIMDISDYSCVKAITERIDQRFRAGLTDETKADDKYCAFGSKEALAYIVKKRTAQAIVPLLHALANTGLKNGAVFQNYRDCQVNSATPCPFLKAYLPELDKYAEVFNKAGLTLQGRRNAVSQIINLLNEGS